MVLGGKTSGGINKVASKVECFDGTKWSILESVNNPEGTLVSSKLVKFTYLF